MKSIVIASSFGVMMCICAFDNGIKQSYDVSGEYYRSAFCAVTVDRNTGAIMYIDPKCPPNAHSNRGSKVCVIEQTGSKLALDGKFKGSISPDGAIQIIFSSGGYFVGTVNSNGDIVGDVYYTDGKKTVSTPNIFYKKPCPTIECKICADKGDYAVFAKKPIALGGIGNENSGANKVNLQTLHEHLFFCSNGKIIANNGFGPDGGFSYAGSQIQANDKEVAKFEVTNGTHFEPQKMKECLKIVSRMSKYKLYWLLGQNCQDFAQDIRNVYHNFKALKSLPTDTQISENDYWKCKSGEVKVYIPMGTVKICSCK